MKRKLCLSLLALSILLLGGCCTDQMYCGSTSTRYVVANTTSCGTCSRCNTCSTCSTCGYDANYTYSGWY